MIKHICTLSLPHRTARVFSLIYSDVAIELYGGTVTTVMGLFEESTLLY